MSTAKRSFLRAFLSSVMGTGLSRVLGAFRDIAIAGFLGAGADSDAFWIAFTIPNTFRRFVADEGLTGALVPAVSQAEEQDGPQEAKKLANSVLGALLVANLIICVAGIVGAEWVVKAFAYSFTENPEQFALTVALTRWLFPFVAFVSLVSFSEGLLNHRGHFFWPKVAPGLVSAGMVGGVLFLGGAFQQPVYALVAGTLVGGLVHVLVNVPPLISKWGWVWVSFAWSSERFKRVMVELGKVVIIGIFAQINILVLRQLAAALGDGAITWYWNANRLVDLSQGIIAVAIGSALLPTVSKAVAARDWERFRTDLLGALRLAGFLLIPTAAVLASFSVPLVSILFRHGRYTFTDVQWTADTLVLLVPFLLAVAGINIVKKVYFALDDRNTLLAIGAMGVALTGLLGWVLVKRWDLPGLALALSSSTVVQLLAYVLVLRRRLGTHMGLTALVSPFARMALASVPAGATLWGLSLLGSWEDGPLSVINLVLVGGGLPVAACVYFAVAWVLRIEELTRLVGVVRRKLGR